MFFRKGFIAPRRLNRMQKILPSYWRKKRTAHRRKQSCIIVLAFAVLALIAVSVPAVERYEKRSVEVWEIRDAVVYAYSSEERQTDSTPTITASNKKVRHGIVANNCLPFGTQVIINDTDYRVEDRMNKRYGCDVFDVWHEDTAQAKKWGKQHLAVAIKK